MSITRFKILAKTVNGKILESPKEFYLPCNNVKPLGRDIVRQYDGNECILSVKVFLVYCNGDVLGSTQFKTLDEFLTYQQGICVPCVEPELLINGCFLTVDNCRLVIGKDPIIT